MEAREAAGWQSDGDSELVASEATAAAALGPAPSCDGSKNRKKRKQAAPQRSAFSAFDSRPAASGSGGGSAPCSPSVRPAATPASPASACYPACDEEEDEDELAGEEDFALADYMPSERPCARSRKGKHDLAGPCNHCGATSSPQWRKGPKGKPQLCNACGIRFLRNRTLTKVVTPKKRRAPGAAPPAIDMDSLPARRTRRATAAQKQQARAAELAAAAAAAAEELSSSPEPEGAWQGEAWGQAERYGGASCYDSALQAAYCSPSSSASLSLALLQHQYLAVLQQQQQQQQQLQQQQPGSPGRAASELAAASSSPLSNGTAFSLPPRHASLAAATQRAAAHAGLSSDSAPLSPLALGGSGSALAGSPPAQPRQAQAQAAPVAAAAQAGGADFLALLTQLGALLGGIAPAIEFCKAFNGNTTAISAALAAINAYAAAAPHAQQQ